MAKLIAKANGKFTAASTWEEEGTKAEKKPTTSDDCQVPSDKTVEGNGGSCRSLELLTGAKWNGVSPLSIGGSSSNGSFALKVSSSESTVVTMSGTAAFEFTSKQNTTEELIYSGGKDLGRVKFATTGEAKYKFAEGLTAVSGPTEPGIFFEGGGGPYYWVDLNAQTFTVLRFILPDGGGVKRFLKVAGATVKVVGTSGQVYELERREDVLSSTGSTFTLEITGSGSSEKKVQFGGSISYGTVTLAADNVVASNVSLSTIAFGTVNFNSPGTANGFTVSGGVIKATTYATNAKSGTGRTIIKGTGGSDFLTFSKSSGTVSMDYVELENVHAEGGATFIAGPNSKDNGGNTGWAFGVSYSDSRSGTATASGTATSAIVHKGTASGAAKASGTKTEAWRDADTSPGYLTLSGTATSSHRRKDTASGTAIASGTSEQDYSRAAERSGTAIASGTSASSHTRIDTASGTAVFSGTAADKWEHEGIASDSAVGAAHGSGSSSESWARSNASSGTAHLTGSATHAHGLRDTASGSTQIAGTGTSQSAFSDSPTGQIALNGAVVNYGVAYMTGMSQESWGSSSSRTGTMHAYGSTTESWTPPALPVSIVVTSLPVVEIVIA